MDFRQEEPNIKPEIVSLKDTLELLLVLKKEWIPSDWYEGHLIPFSKTTIKFNSPTNRANYIKYLVENRMLLSKTADFQGKPIVKYKLNEKLKLSPPLTLSLLGSLSQVLPSGDHDEEMMKMIRGHLGVSEKQE